KEEAIKNLYNLIGSMKENINFFERFINEEDDAIVEAAINLETFLNEGDKVNLKMFKYLDENQIEKFTNYLPEIFKTLVLECAELQEDRDLVLKCKIEEAMKNKWRKQSYAYKPHRDEPVGTKKLKFFDFDKYLDPEQNVKLDQ